MAQQTIHCPNCRHPYALTPQLAGQQVRCRHCGGVFRVPTAAATEVYQLLDETASAQGSPFGQTAFRPAGRGIGMGLTESVMLGLGAILSLLALVCLFALWGSSVGTVLAMLAGATGATLCVAALQKNFAAACLVGGGIVLVLLIGLVISSLAGGSSSRGGGDPPVAGTVPPPTTTWPPETGTVAPPTLTPSTLPSQPPPPAATTTSAPAYTAASAAPVASASPVSSHTASGASGTAATSLPPAESSPASPGTAGALVASGTPTASVETPPAPAGTSTAPAETPAASQAATGPAFGPAPSTNVAGGNTQVIGGYGNGNSYHFTKTGSPIVGVAYQPGQWMGRPGFKEVELLRANDVAVEAQRASRPMVVARNGYALGGITVDSGDEFFHAMQLIFARLGPDGRLDLQNSYVSPWIGTPVGAQQTVVSSGPQVVGIQGRRVLLVHSIGLIYFGAERMPSRYAAGPRFSPPPMRPPGFPPSRSVPTPVPSPAVESSPSPAPAVAATPDPTPAPTPRAPPKEIPQTARDALASVVLVEHSTGSGSGFAVATDVVATNAHVVEGAFAEEIRIHHGSENDPSRRVLRVLHYDRGRDLCLLQVDTELKPLPVRSDYTIQVGDEVTLLGNPAVAGSIVMRDAANQGRLTNIVRIDAHDYYQIDAAVNPGWSGGPVVDAEGRVIAVVAMKANDESVTEIREAMERLDANFGNRFGGEGNAGITYGIPASALAVLVSDPKLLDSERMAQAGDRFLADVVAQRLFALSSLAMLQMQVTVPAQVRAEAEAMMSGKLPPPSRLARMGPKIDYLPLLPSEVADRIRLVLEHSASVRRMKQQCVSGLDEGLEAVSKSTHLDPSLARNLRALARKVEDAGDYLARPAGTYAAYSVKVGGISRDLRELLTRVETDLESSP